MYRIKSIYSDDITKEHIRKWEKLNRQYKNMSNIQEIVYWYVQGSKDISLPDVQTLLFKKHLMKDKANPYLVDEKVVKDAYNKAIWERDNQEEIVMREERFF